MTEKVLARKAGRTAVVPGELLWVQVDVACIDDVQFHLFERVFGEIGRAPWDRDRTVMVADHYTPPSDPHQAEIVRAMRDFGELHGLRHVFLSHGIKHGVLPEAGLVHPGTLVVATDSHTNTMGAYGSLATALGPSEVAGVWAFGETWLKVPETVRVDVTGQLSPWTSAKDITLRLLGDHGTRFARYRAVEFGGDGVRTLPVEERAVLCNMTTEMGAKNALVETEAGGEWSPDPAARYVQQIPIDAASLEPLVAAPSSPGNVKRVRDLPDTPVDQAFLGTCTSGNLRDLTIAADILKGRKVHPRVQLIVTPLSRGVLQQAMATGVIDTLIEAGAIVTSPGCGACAGGHMGVLGPRDVRISTQNRNFVGRGGHPSSEIYLASPATVAASALTGRITDPRELGDGMPVKRVD